MQERDVVAYISALLLLDNAMGEHFKRPEEVAYIGRYRGAQGVAVGHIVMKHAHGRKAQHRLTRMAVDLMHRVKAIPEAQEYSTGDRWMGIVHFLTVLEHDKYRVNVDSPPLLALQDYIRAAQAMMRDSVTKKINPEHVQVCGLSMSYLRYYHSEKCFRAIDTEALAP